MKITVHEASRRSAVTIAFDPSIKPLDTITVYSLGLRLIATYPEGSKYCAPGESDQDEDKWIWPEDFERAGAAADAKGYFTFQAQDLMKGGKFYPLVRTCIQEFARSQEAPQLDVLIWGLVDMQFHSLAGRKAPPGSKPLDLSRLFAVPRADSGTGTWKGTYLVNMRGPYKRRNFKFQADNYADAMRKLLEIDTGEDFVKADLEPEEAQEVLSSYGLKPGTKISSKTIDKYLKELASEGDSLFGSVEGPSYSWKSDGYDDLRFDRRGYEI